MSWACRARGPIPMAKNRNGGLRRFARGFRWAFCGIGRCIRSERNMRVHTVMALYVLVLSAFFPFNAGERALLWVCIGMVMAAETFNTAIEKLCDRFCPEHDERIGRVKDLAAGAVLLTALGALGAGISLFWRPQVLLSLWQNLCGQPLWGIAAAGALLLGLWFIRGKGFSEK